MLLTVTLPQVNAHMATATILTCYPQPGSPVVPGTKLLDIRVDLSQAITHDCPPISFHRIGLRERAWLRRLLVSPGQEVPVGAPLALLSTEADESLEAVAQRLARCSVAGILPPQDWWSGETR